MNYQRILIAIDVYSEYDLLLQRALRIAANPSQIHLVFVTLPKIYFQPYISCVGTDYVAEIQGQAKRRLGEIASDMALPLGQFYLPIGNIAEEIHRLAIDIAADLIIIGTQKRKGFSALLGATASSVLNNAKQDVLAVRICLDGAAC